jgi:hypothetical protein
VSRASFAGEVHVGDGVSIVACDFTQCADIDRLNLIGADLFPNTPRQLSNPPANSEKPVPPQEMASIHRQLRSNLEGRNNRPAANWFYWGEMENRRQATRGFERVVLAGYKHIAGYGLSVLRPALAFLLVALAGTIAFQALPDTPLTQQRSHVDTFTFTVQSMLSFFSPPDDDLSTSELWVQIALRFAGPVLLAFAGLAVRERVAR